MKPGLITPERLRELLLNGAPRPKIAAGVLAYVVLQVLAQVGVDVPAFLGLPRETIEALIVFGVMWLVRDRFAIPMSEAIAAKARAAGLRDVAERAAELGASLHASDPPDLRPRPRVEPSHHGHVHVAGTQHPPPGASAEPAVDVADVRQPTSPGQGE